MYIFSKFFKIYVPKRINIDYYYNISVKRNTNLFFGKSY